MISLPGLSLVQGRFEDAREILLSYAQYVSKGMIPNRFPDYGETPEYNTVDASLWYISQCTNISALQRISRLFVRIYMVY